MLGLIAGQAIITSALKHMSEQTNNQIDKQDKYQLIDVKGNSELEKLQKLVFQIDEKTGRSFVELEGLKKEQSVLASMMSERYSQGSELLCTIFDRNELNDFGKVIFDYSVIESEGKGNTLEVFPIKFKCKTLYQTVFWALAILSVDKRNEEEKLSAICNLWTCARNGKIKGCDAEYFETEDFVDIVALVGAVMSGKRGEKIEFKGENITRNFLGLDEVVKYYVS